MNTVIRLQLAAIFVVAAACGPVEPSNSADTGFGGDTGADVPVDTVPDAGFDTSQPEEMSTEEYCRLSTRFPGKNPRAPFGEIGAPEYGDCEIEVDMPRVHIPTREGPLWLRSDPEFTQDLNTADAEIELCRREDEIPTVTHFVDLNGDGATDILGSRTVVHDDHDGTQWCRLESGYRIQNPDGTRGEFQLLEGVYRIQPIGSLNDDAYTEYTVMSELGGVAIWVHEQGTPLETSEVIPLHDSFDGVATPTVADVDGNGYLDVFIPISGDADLFFENFGDLFLEEVAEESGVVLPAEIVAVVDLSDDPFWYDPSLLDMRDPDAGIMMFRSTDGGNSFNIDYYFDGSSIVAVVTYDVFDVACDIMVDYHFNMNYGYDFTSASQFYDLIGLIANRFGLDSQLQAVHAAHGPNTPEMGGSTNPMGSGIISFGNVTIRVFTQSTMFGQSFEYFDPDRLDRGEPSRRPLYALNIFPHLSSEGYDLLGWGIQELVTGGGVPTILIAYGSGGPVHELDPAETDRSCDILLQIGEFIPLDESLIDCPEPGEAYGNGYLGVYEASAPVGELLKFVEAEVETDLGLDVLGSLFSITVGWYDFADGRPSELMLIVSTFYGFSYAFNVELDGNLARIRVEAPELDDSTPYDGSGCVIRTQNDVGYMTGRKVMNMIGTNIHQGNYRGELSFSAQESNVVDVELLCKGNEPEIHLDVPADMQLHVLTLGEGVPGTLEQTVSGRKTRRGIEMMALDLF